MKWHESVPVRGRYRQEIGMTRQAQQEIITTMSEYFY